MDIRKTRPQVYLLTLLVLGLCLVGCGRRTIHGQVFIVTRGHESVKLGLVTVALYPEGVVREHIAKRRLVADDCQRSLVKAQAAVEHTHSTLETTPEEVERSTSVRDSIVVALEYLRSGRAYLDSLPKPIRVAQTDANGEFSLEIPRFGDYVLVAHAERLVIDSVEEYTWILAMPKGTGHGTKILLSNETLTTAASPLSLVRTPF